MAYADDQSYSEHVAEWAELGGWNDSEDDDDEVVADT